MLYEQEVTQLLIDWGKGDQKALDQLMPLVEKELRRLAAHFMRGERPNHTLQTTALVNEAYLRLVDQKQVQWQNHAHFLAIAARLMRRILLDHARRQGRAKRGGGAQQVSLSGAMALPEEMSADLIALDEALGRLKKIDPVKDLIVELRYFGGLSVEETAEVLGVAPITVIRHWNMAKAWLKRELKGESHT
jgi:RNA polymerase sigma factor (TIGR02999 family)